MQWINKQSYYLTRGTLTKDSKGKKYWFKSGRKQTVGGRIWSHYDHYKLKGDKVSSKRYSDIDDALIGE